MSNRKTLIRVGVYVVLAFCLFLGGVLFRDHLIRAERDARFRLVGALLDHQAPAVETYTLDGQVWRLSDFRGKVVILEFWATWCPGSTQVLEAMKRLHDEFAGRADVIVVGVALDRRGDAVRAFCRENKVDWPQLFEPERMWKNSVARTFGVTAVPSYVVIDRAGRVQVLDSVALDLRWVVRQLSDGQLKSNYAR